MVRANKRNEALRIESALLNKIAMLGTEKTAEAVGVDKSQSQQVEEGLDSKVLNAACCS
ncbi:Regulatory protein CII [Escherichia coli]|uniref:Regulatory protein CII n=1 Tax=Escherichia coli TaxID=562 RepID=A0A484X0R5_ECOLX|nr:Regulatory protein CII [Escherichia coli]